MRFGRSFLVLAVLFCATSAALAQGLPTGTLAGRVTAAGAPQAGATVTATSPALQGARSTTTNANGDFTLPLLPPGDYTVTYDLDGFRRVERSVKISAALTVSGDQALELMSASEEIVVTAQGAYETISTEVAAAATFEKTTVEALPILRDIRDTVLLNAGVATGGPGGGRARGITISGAQSFDNLFLVNGVVINENLRGQPFNLFIEDAIQETTTQTSGISAEYGRFGGGVVNTITKSGGNQVSGSFRDSLTNNSWESETPLTVSQADDVNSRYEATLGGWIMKDRLWYFGAARDFNEQSVSQTASPTRLPYDAINDEQRYEAKLTVSPFEGHRFVGSYIEIARDENGNVFQNVLDRASLVNRSLPQSLFALNYTGVLSSNLFAEAQYSKREFTFEDAGSIYTDRIRGTLLIDDEGFRWNSPTFCGVCSPEERNNEDLLAKLSWFASTDRLGSHDLLFGYDTFDDVRLANNHQSGSDFRVFLTDTLIRDNGEALYPVILGDDTTEIVWNPILIDSEGTDFRTNSLFVNDRWRLNQKWTFNLGVRYDRNDGVDSQGQKVADDSKFSPRLGLVFDPHGDGEWLFNFSYGEYVSALANTQGDATSQGGNPATIAWFYRGPDINADPNGVLVPTDEALDRMWAWFDAEGGVNNETNLDFISIPGGTTVIPDTLRSPAISEIALGVTKRFGGQALVRAEVVHREGMDFYSERKDLSTGRVTTPNGVTDLAVIENKDDVLERTYNGLHLQFQGRGWERLSYGGSYTLSKSEGNFEGETSAAGPVRGIVLDFPEYKQARWNSPVGDLTNDQRHRARLFAIYDLWKGTANRLSVGLLQSFTSGTPYGALGAVDPRDSTGTFGIPNPGYVQPPSSVAYYYTPRDEFHTDDITSTDLTLNYSFIWHAFGKSCEIFIQPEVLNVFDEHGVISVNQSVQDWTNNRSLQRFNPFTQTPVENVNWRKGSLFGQPTLDTDYQTPRTYRFSVGFRF